MILDDVWSTTIRALDPDDQAAIESQGDEFTELFSDFEQALDDAIEQIDELQIVLNSATPDDFEAAVAVISDVSPQFAEAVQHIFAQQIEEVEVRGASIFACQYLVDQKEEIRQVLRTKYDDLMEGRLPNPGLPKSVRCALYLAGIGGGVATLIATHGAIAIVGAVVGPSTAAILSWEKSGCIETWRTIAGGRLA